jgi:hypothetical protein
VTAPDQDQELEAFLKRRSPIHRRLADFDHVEPSLELDRLVLNRAREAIDVPAQPPMFRTLRWAMPVGLAATILIAFTVVLNVDHRAHPLQKQVAAAKSDQPATPTAQLTANRAVSETRPAEPASDRGAAGALSKSAAEALPAAATEPQTERREKKAEAPLLVASTHAGYRETDLATPATASSASASEPDSRPSKKDPARTDKLSDKALLASSSAISALSDRAAASPPPAAAPAPTAPAYQASADAWLREINRLRAAGKSAEANRELTAFRQAYPGHPGYSLARPPTR